MLKPWGGVRAWPTVPGFARRVFRRVVDAAEVGPMPVPPITGSAALLRPRGHHVGQSLGQIGLKEVAL
jgi:hypothetical protein